MGAPAEKHRLSVRTAASGPPRANRVSGVDAHNAALRAAQARVDELEGKLADLLVPILEAAGRKAASNFRARAPVGMVAALTAAGPGVASNSTMVALKPRPAEAEALGLSTSIPTETLHVTLAYLGEIDGPLEPIAAALAAVAANHAPIVGEVAGGGFFGHPDGGGPTILLPDVPGLVELRVDVSEALTTAEIPYSRDHGFQAHVTVAYRGDPEGEFPPELDYRPSDDPTIRCGTCLRFDGARGVCVMFDAPAEPEMVCDEWTDEPYDPIGEPLHFDSILIVRGDTEIVEIPLVGVPPLTAASPPPGWIPPAGDEIVDVDTLVKTLRTKTDPVRRALLEASMTPGLGAAGLDFDVTNPFTAKVLSRAGQNVRSIALTTQLNVMRSVKSAYSNGLSVPDTASLIQAGMSAAAPARATMIARTELAGAVNGGSLAATQIVSDVTGDRYVKRWLTAPGAVYPRHELYEGLDGQEQPLDGLFEVGGSPLMFPGDPDGDPGETINCRCTLVYNSPEGEGEASAEDSPPDFGTVDGGSLAVDSPPAGDTVSVGTGPFVPAEMVSRITELGLNRPLSDLTPTTTIGRSVFATAPDTEALYKVAGEWTPDRRALHEDIIAKHFAGKVATGDKPSAFFTAGGGASGKSHALFNVDGADVGLKDLGDRSDVVWIDPDRIKAMLPEYEKLRDAGDLYAASGVHEESSALAKEITAEAQRRGLSMIVDTTGSSHAFVQKLQAAADAGYEVKTTMFSIPTNEAIVRSMDRGRRSGRYVAIQALKAAHAGSAQQLAIWKDAGFVKEWRVYDNSGSSPKLVASGGGGTFKVYDEPAWDSILAKSSEATGSSSTVAATTKVPLAKPTPYKTVVADLGKEPSPIQGEEQIATGLDPAVARSLWYLPDIGPRANELVRLGVNPSTIPVDAAKATTVSQTFRDAIAAGRSKIKTWADVIRIAERDAAPLRHDALLLRGMTVREVPKVGDVLSDAQGMVSLTSDAGTADAFALRAPPPAAAGRMGANPAEEEAIAAMLDKGGPRQFLAPGEKAIRLEVETPAGTRLWNPGGDLDEFVVPKGSEFRVTEVRAATRADNFEPYADSPPDVDYIVRGRLEPIAEKPSVATLVPGNPETVDFVTQERAAKFAKFATRWQVDAAGYQEKLDEQVRNAVAGAEIRVRVGHEALERIIGDGRFKSQFESNSSGGLLSPKYRAAVENQMFGYSEDLDPTLRPIYGYLSGSLGSTDLVDETYGSVMVRLKQAAADRATFTLSDSLGAGERRELVPQPLSNPNALALPIENFSSDPLRAIQPSLERISSSYAEAQIHGGLTLDDVAEVVLNRRALSQEAIQARAEISYLEGWISDAEELAKENPSPNDSFQREIEARRAQIAVYQAELARVENEGAALKAALEKAGIPYRVVPDGKTLEELPAG